MDTQDTNIVEIDCGNSNCVGKLEVNPDSVFEVSHYFNIFSPYHLRITCLECGTENLVTKQGKRIFAIPLGN